MRIVVFVLSHCCPRIWLLAWVVLPLLLSGALQAQEAGLPQRVDAGLDKLLLGPYWEQTVLPAQHGLDASALMALPQQQFVRGTARKGPAAGPTEELVLRTQLQFAPALVPGSSTWALEIPAARLDDVRVSYRFDGGAWQSARMGDRVPYTQWPLPNTHAVLKLAGQGQNLDLVLQVRHSGRFGMPVWLKTDAKFHTDQVGRGLYHGLVVGFMLAVALVCVASWRAFGNSAFLWLALQLSFFALGELAYHGYGDLLLWRDASPWWREHSKFISTMMILSAMLPAFAAYAGLRSTDPLAWWGCLALGALVLCLGFATPLLLPAEGRVVVGAVLSLLVLGVAAGLCRVVLVRRERLGPWLSLCLGLYAACIVVTALEVGAVIPGSSGSVVAPAGYALGTLFLVYGLFVSHRFGKIGPVPRRASALVDPATGLPNREAFGNELARQILALRASGQVAVLLWVRLGGAEEAAQERGREAFEAGVLRWAAALADCIQSGEPLARLDDATFAIIATGHSNAKSADALAATVLARTLSSFDRQDKVDCRVVMVPLPAGRSTVEGIAHLCEHALKTAPAGKRILRLRSGGAFESTPTGQ